MTVMTKGQIEATRRDAEAMRLAVSGEHTEGTFHATNWSDKPHRVLYDALKHIDNIARTAIALHQQLADSQAAQALVIERAAEAAENVDYPWTQGDHLNQMDASDTTARAIAEAIRALASPSGVEALAALRDEAEKWRSIASDNGLAAMDNLAAIVALEGERDALAAKLAATEARVGALAEALRPFASVVKQMSQNHFKIEDDDLLKISGKDLLRANDTLAALTTPAEETKG